MKKISFNLKEQANFLKAIKNKVIKGSVQLKRRSFYPEGITSGIPNKKTLPKFLSGTGGDVKGTPLKGIAGKLIFPKKKDAYHAVRDKLGPDRLPAMNGRQRKTFNAIIKSHEVAESSAKYHPKFFEQAHHMSPSVILREHNVLRGLPEKGKKEMTALFKSFRTDLDTSANVISKQFPKFTYGDSPRLSRHAIKRMSEKFK